MLRWKRTLRYPFYIFFTFLAPAASKWERFVKHNKPRLTSVVIMIIVMMEEKPR